jgi:hypothetical protein
VSRAESHGDTAAAAAAAAACCVCVRRSPSPPPAATGVECTAPPPPPPLPSPAVTGDDDRAAALSAARCCCSPLLSFSPTPLAPASPSWPAVVACIVAGELPAPPPAGSPALLLASVSSAAEPLAVVDEGSFWGCAGNPRYGPVAHTHARAHTSVRISGTHTLTHAHAHGHSGGVAAAGMAAWARLQSVGLAVRRTRVRRVVAAPAGAARWAVCHSVLSVLMNAASPAGPPGAPAAQVPTAQHSRHRLSVRLPGMWGTRTQEAGKQAGRQPHGAALASRE